MIPARFPIPMMGTMDSPDRSSQFTGSSEGGWKTPRLWEESVLFWWKHRRFACRCNGSQLPSFSITEGDFHQRRLHVKSGHDGGVADGGRAMM